MLLSLIFQQNFQLWWCFCFQNQQLKKLIGNLTNLKFQQVESVELKDEKDFIIFTCMFKEINDKTFLVRLYDDKRQNKEKNLKTMLSTLPPNKHLVQFYKMLKLKGNKKLREVHVMLQKGLEYDAFVFEYIPKPLKTFIEEKNCDISQKIQFCIQVGETVSFLKDNHVIIRNLKLDHLRIDDEGVVVINDLSKAIIVDNQFSCPYDEDSDGKLQVTAKYRLDVQILEKIRAKESMINYSMQSEWEYALACYEIFLGSDLDESHVIYMKALKEKGVDEEICEIIAGLLRQDNRISIREALALFYSHPALLNTNKVNQPNQNIVDSISQLETEKDKLNESLKESITNYSLLEQKMKKEIENLQKSESDIKSKLEDSINTIKTLEGEKEQLLTHSNTLHDQHKEEVNTLKSSENDLKILIEQHKSEANTLKSSEVDLKNLNAKLQGEKVELNELLQETIDMNNQLEGEKKLIQKRISIA